MYKNINIYIYVYSFIYLFIYINNIYIYLFIYLFICYRYIYVNQKNVYIEYIPPSRAGGKRGQKMMRKISVQIRSA